MVDSTETRNTNVHLGAEIRRWPQSFSFSVVFWTIVAGGQIEDSTLGHILSST